MKDNKFELTNLDAILYKYTLDNGLNVYLLPYENKTNYYIHYVTKFGSVNTEFVPIDEENMVKVPDGIAHFLEHKMFEMEDGMNPFEFSSLTGTVCNASTSHKCTRYLFEGTKAFEENLDYLLNYVHKPYFTDENVEKEKGIITEELLQYKDMVDMEIDLMVLDCLFHNDPVKVDIGGTVESIKDITKEDLYKTYNTFYQPSNMFIVITGNFDKDKAIEIIKNNEIVNSCKTNHEIIIKKVDEPIEIKNKFIDTNMDVQSTRLNYSIKVPISSYKGIERYKYVNYFGMMLNIMFGLASDFREEMLKNEYMTSFYYDRMYTDDYMIITFFALTEVPEKLVEEIKKCLENINVTSEDVERIKKVWISSEVMMIDDASLTLDNFVYDIIESGEVIPNKVDIFKEMNLEKLLDIVNNVDYSNSTTVIVRPQEEIL